MLEIIVPGRKTYRLKNLVLDLNGTVALDGEMVAGVEERLRRLSACLNITVVTADTHGTAGRLGESLAFSIRGISGGGESAQKLSVVQDAGWEETVSIGNGCNDVLMLRESALGICVIGAEGAAPEAVTGSDVVVRDINDALDLLLFPDRLVATLRR